MKESDFILATNYARLEAAQSLIHKVTCTTDRSQEAWAAVMRDIAELLRLNDPSKPTRKASK